MIPVELHVAKANAGSTEVWSSEAVRIELASRHERVDSKLAYFAEGGFDQFMRGKPPRILAMTDLPGVYRIQLENSLFRVYGFFDVYPSCFIALDAFERNHSRVRPRHITRIRENVLTVKENGSWEKSEEGSNHDSFSS